MSNVFWLTKVVVPGTPYVTFLAHRAYRSSCSKNLTIRIDLLGRPADAVVAVDGDEHYEEA